MIRSIIGVAIALLVIVFFIWPGWLWQRPLWEQLGWGQPPVVQVPSPSPPAVPAAPPTRPAEPAKVTGVVTVTVASLTQVATRVWVQECKLDSGKPECEWVLRQETTEAKVEPRVSVPVSTATVTPTVTARTTATPTPTATATAVPSPTVAPAPAVAAPAPQVAPAEPKVEPPKPSAPAPPPSAPAPAPPPTKPPYWETGVGLTATWTIQVPAGSVLIVGGYRVGDQSGGFYTAYPGSQTVTLTITDGFATLVGAEAAPAEFCTRVRQARQMGWALSTVKPLPGWSAC